MTHYLVINVAQWFKMQITAEKRLSKVTVFTACTICKKELSSKGNLNFHVRSVHQKIKHKCTICKKEFSAKGSLNYHDRSVHQKIKYKCHICQKLFSSKRYINMHIRSVHQKNNK